MTPKQRKDFEWIRDNVHGEQRMTDEERNSMREHIVWLTLQLDKERSKVKLRDALLADMINPDELGHAVTQEIRGRIYSILYLTENN